MHSVVETPTYLDDFEQAEMDADERQAIVTYVALNPQAGVMADAGIATQFRFKRPGMGKSSGYHMMLYFGGNEVPLFLLNVFAKGDRANLP